MISLRSIDNGEQVEENDGLDANVNVAHDESERAQGIEDAPAGAVFEWLALPHASHCDGPEDVHSDEGAGHEQKLYNINQCQRRSTQNIQRMLPTVLAVRWIF